MIEAVPGVAVAVDCPDDVTACADTATVATRAVAVWSVGATTSIRRLPESVERRWKNPGIHRYLIAPQLPIFSVTPMLPPARRPRVI